MLRLILKPGSHHLAKCDWAGTCRRKWMMRKSLVISGLIFRGYLHIKMGLSLEPVVFSVYVVTKAQNHIRLFTCQATAAASLTIDKLAVSFVVAVIDGANFS